MNMQMSTLPIVRGAKLIEAGFVMHMGIFSYGSLSGTKGNVRIEKGREAERISDPRPLSASVSRLVIEKYTEVKK
jgi:hypothetical protein